MKQHIENTRSQSDAVAYVASKSLAVEYFDKDGARGKPTGLMTSGGAEAIFGKCEVFSPNVAIIKFRENSHVWPFESDPTPDVLGFNCPVIFYFPMTWEELEFACKNR